MNQVNTSCTTKPLVDMHGQALLFSLSSVFQNLCTLFPALSSAKLKEGIFVGPHMIMVLKDKDFDDFDVAASRCPLCVILDIFPKQYF